MSPRALAATLPKVTKSVLEKHGRAYATVVAEWPNIVGPALADVSLPEKLGRGAKADAGGVLTVRVAGAAAMELQHLAPQIMERINVFLGFPAVSRLKLVQAPLPGEPPRRPRPARQASPAAKKAVRAAAAAIEEPHLRAALERFGDALAADHAGTAEPVTPPRTGGSRR